MYLALPELIRVRRDHPRLQVVRQKVIIDLIVGAASYAGLRRGCHNIAGPELVRYSRILWNPGCASGSCSKRN